MKLTGGTFKGRDIARPPRDTTRPITGRATEALFNMLGDITDLTALDLYAGSGVLGIEALSRGAASVTAVERDAHAASIIQNNYSVLGAEDFVNIETQPVELWLMRDGGTFDLVFVDPPFADFEAIPLAQIAARTERVLMLRHSSIYHTPEPKGMQLRRQRQYGNSILVLYTPDAAQNSDK